MYFLIHFLPWLDFSWFYTAWGCLYIDLTNICTVAFLVGKMIKEFCCKLHCTLNFLPFWFLLRIFSREPLYIFLYVTSNIFVVSPCCRGHGLNKLEFTIYEDAELTGHGNFSAYRRYGIGSECSFSKRLEELVKICRASFEYDLKIGGLMPI